MTLDQKFDGASLFDLLDPEFEFDKIDELIHMSSCNESSPSPTSKFQTLKIIVFAYINPEPNFTLVAVRASIKLITFKKNLSK